MEKEIADLKRRVAGLVGAFGLAPRSDLFLHNNVDTRFSSLEGKVENSFARMDTRFDSWIRSCPALLLAPRARRYRRGYDPGSTSYL